MCLLCRLPALAEATYRDHFCRLASSSSASASQKISVIFLWNHTGQLPDIWHRASVWTTVTCNAFLNLRHVHFLFYATLNIVDIGKFAHKMIYVRFFSGTTEASFLIFGTEHKYGEPYRVTRFWICGMSKSCLTRLWIFKRKVGRRHMSSLEDRLTTKSCTSFLVMTWIYELTALCMYFCIVIFFILY